MSEPFVPGFKTAAAARKAGAKFFARGSRVGDMPGREGRHFHLVQNEHGRWHFEEGAGPKTPPNPPSRLTREGARA